MTPGVHVTREYAYARLHGLVWVVHEEQHDGNGGVNYTRRVAWTGTLGRGLAKLFA